MQYRCIAAIAALSLSLCGCAVQYDAAAAKAVNTIHIQAPEEPKYFAAIPFVPGQNPMQLDGFATFDTLMAAQNLHMGAELASAVSDGLKSDGYQISQNDA